MSYLDEKNHQYYNDKNEPIPSVTQVISILNKKGLVKWANILGFKKISAEKLVNEKAMIGSLLHDRISKFFKKEEYQPHLSEEINAQVDVLYSRFLQWYEIATPLVILSEENYINEFYGGTIDLLCKIQDKTYLIDFKTSKKIHSSQFVQLGGYLTLIEELDPDLYNNIDRCQIISFTSERILYESRERKQMKPYENVFKNSYILYSEYDKILREEWNDSLKGLKEI